MANETTNKVIRYFIENYYSGLTILDDDGNYVRYFDNHELADEYLNDNFYHRKDFDNFYIVKEVDGKVEPLEL